MPEYKEIEYWLLWKSLHEQLSDDELQELRVWLNAKDANRVYYNRLKQNYSNAAFEVEQEELALSWKQLSKHLTTPRSVVFRRCLYYAAAVLVPLVLGLGVWWLADTKPVEAPVSEQHIVPGTSQAVLHLANGEQLFLEKGKKQVVINGRGQAIGTDSLNVLTYTGDVESNVEEYNTITVPRGGEYRLVLADGTEVWLNSETTLRYPVAFSNNTRVVELSGEAFFEVTTNRDRPFIVKTPASEVVVTGTAFNVMCYEAEMHEETTLVEGRVSVRNAASESKIAVGQQLLLQKTTGRMQVQEVDTDLFTSWKDGVFRFEGMPLEEIVRKISRWYNVQFFFSNQAVRQKRFTGGVKRNTGFREFMHMIEETSKVAIEINGNTVLIKDI